MESSGEHFTPVKTSPVELEINLDRYLFAINYIKDKTVIDLGAGAGLGTYFYSLFAKHVYAIDYDKLALEEANKWPYPRPNIDFLHLDITNPEDVAKFPDADICIALEILEHVEDPAAVLKALRTPQLVFSLPLHSMEMSSWHRFPIENAQDVKKLIEPFYQISTFESQRHPRLNGEWIRGEGTRFSQ